MLLLLACTWVTTDEKEALFSTLDEDGDNARADVDCDDNDPLRRPGVEEIWYDGVDQNCDGINDYDQDQDGYVPTEYADQAGELGSGDCCDICGAISPAQADPAYDGLDQNCDGADDFDADGDGYATLADRSFSTSVSGTDCDTSLAGQPVSEFCAVAVQAVPTGTDCYDSPQDINEGFEDTAELGSSSVNPGATDIPYDGTNADCGGCDDFDADCDGYIALDYGGDDCNDNDQGIVPGAAEVLCDGIDQDCDGEDARDQDGDNFPGCFAEEGEFLDCDDTNILIYPGAIESSADAIDGDCDGNANTVNLIGLTTRGWSFTNPLSVSYAAIGNALYLSVVADQLHAETSDGSLDAYDGSTGLLFDESNAGINYTLLTASRWSSSSADTNYSVLPGERILISGATIYELSAANITQGTDSFPRLTIYKSGGTTEQFSPTDPITPFEDIALAFDTNGIVHAFGCSTGGDLAYLQWDNTTITEVLTGYPASTCAADADSEVHLFLHDSGIVQEYDGTYTSSLTLTPTSFAPTISTQDIEVTTGDNGRTIAIANDNGNIKLYNVDNTTDDIRDSNDTLRLEVKEYYDGSRIIGFVNDAQEAWIAYDTGFGYNIVGLTLPFGLTPHDISIWSGNSGIHIAVSGSYQDGTGDIALGTLSL